MLEKELEYCMVNGITIENANMGRSRFVRIDLDRYGDNEYLNLFFKENGVEIEKPVKWTKKMLESFEQAKNGEWTKGDIDNFWNI